MGPRDVAMRTGLTRDQQRYCEEKGYLGDVVRNGGGERAFTEPQLQFFESLARLRATGLNLEEAAALAAESLEGGVPKVSDTRLDLLLTRSIEDVVRVLGSAIVFWGLARHRHERRFPPAPTKPVTEEESAAHGR